MDIYSIEFIKDDDAAYAENILSGYRNVKLIYGNSFFDSEDNIRDVFIALPHDDRTINMIQGILDGQVEHIAQSDIASQLLGTAQALVVKEIILGNPVKTSPKPIRIYLTEMISA